MTDTISREDLVDKADSLVARLQDRVLTDTRAALNEAELVKKGRALDEALDVFDKAQHDRRIAEDEEATAREALEAAEVAARWEAAAKVTTEGNKSYVPAPDGDETGERRQVTAAVRDEWIAQQVTQDPTVQARRRELRKAEHHTAEAKDALERSRQVIGVRKIQAELAVTHVAALSAGLRDRGER